MSFPYLQQQDPEVYQSLLSEMQRQSEGLELIPSENYVSPAVLEVLGSVFTNKYSEGYPGKRYYGGQQNTDFIESLAIARAKELFKAEHANVQPLSGAPANLAVYMGLLKHGDTILGMDLSHGGHLSHGHPVTHVAGLYKFVRYKMSNVTTGEIDYEELRKVAHQYKPKLMLAGFSSYPRNLNYQLLKEIADEVGAYTMMDAAHIAGLIAGGVLSNPFDFGFDIITATTHKTLRGPRGGLILCKQEFSSAIDKSVFPGLQGGPHMNNVAAKAVAFGEALRPEFKQYTRQVLLNAEKFASVLNEAGVKLITGGTSNHLLLIDVINSFGIAGKQAQEILDTVGITTNMNVIPDDPRGPMDPSGLRIGTPAITTRGANENHIQRIAELLLRALRNREEAELKQIGEEVRTLAKELPVPGVS